MKQRGGPHFWGWKRIEPI
jgi:hypothetical protein